MRELALRSGMSVAQLSRIESGERQPSFGSLISLADAFSLTPSEFLADAPGASILNPPISPGQATELDGIRVSALSRPHPSGFTVVRLRFKARDGNREYQVHSGTEWLYVTRGSVRLRLSPGTGSTEPRAYVLAEGDAAQYSARTPHKLEWAPGTKQGEALLLTLPDVDGSEVSSYVKQHDEP